MHNQKLKRTDMNGSDETTIGTANNFFPLEDIHSITEEERRSMLETSNAHLELQQKLKEKFKEEPPLGISANITVRVSDLEYQDFLSEIYKIFKGKAGPEDIILHLICELTGFRSFGSHERLLANEWLDHVKISANIITAPSFDIDTLQERSFVIPLLDWEDGRIRDIASQHDMTLDTLVERFICDISGFRLSSGNFGQYAFAWLNGVYTNF